MRKLHHLDRWNRWLSHDAVGKQLLTAEQHILAQLLQKHYGKQAVLIGAPAQEQLLETTPVLRHTLLSPMAHHKTVAQHIESDLHELPLLSGSVDLVILPHTLEFTDNPQHLLAESCRIIKPEGLIAVCGINPYSAWGLKKGLGRAIPAKKIRSWLALNEFVLEKKQLCLYRPPVASRALFRQLHFMEFVLGHGLPFLGGVYVLLARAKVLPLTPIRLKWKQQLGNIRLSTTLTGHIARTSDEAC